MEEIIDKMKIFGAGEGIRTLDPNLGKVVLSRSSLKYLSGYLSVEVLTLCFKWSEWQGLLPPSLTIALAGVSATLNTEAVPVV
jgi:hypothetical protein